MFRKVGKGIKLPFVMVERILKSWFPTVVELWKRDPIYITKKTPEDSGQVKPNDNTEMFACQICIAVDFPDEVNMYTVRNKIWHALLRFGQLAGIILKAKASKLLVQATKLMLFSKIPVMIASCNPKLSFSLHTNSERIVKFFICKGTER